MRIHPTLLIASIGISGFKFEVGMNSHAGARELDKNRNVGAGLPAKDDGNKSSYVRDQGRSYEARCCCFYNPLPSTFEDGSPGKNVEIPQPPDLLPTVATSP